jgi:hypothetical protein
MAAELSLKLSFSALSASSVDGDLIFEYRAEFADSPLPVSPPTLTVSVDRVEGAKKRGRVRVLIPDANGRLSNARPAGEDANGALADVVVDAAPLRTADSLLWRFFVSSEPGGKNPALVVTAQAPPAKPVKVTSPGTAASLPRPSATATTLPLTPGVFPRFVVGIDSAKLAPDTTPSPFDASAGNIQKCLERVFARLIDAGFVKSALEGSLPGAGVTAPKVVPSPAQPGNTTVQDAELAWANQVALMQLCTPYGGPNGMYNLNDDDLLVRGINSPGPPDKAVFPITFACQHLGTFAVAARGRGLFKLNDAGTRFLLLGAGASCASTWTSSKIGKWMVTTPDGTAPAESTDGGKGDPNLLVPDERLETSQLLFKIKDVASTHPFGSAAIFLYSNRQARGDGLCSIVGGVETCLLKDRKGNFRIEDVPVFEEREVTFADGTRKKKKVLVKNPDGTIKTVRQTARTTWAVSKFPSPPDAEGKPTKLLADNTAGAHLAYVLRVDNRLQVFQTFDTGGVNVPKRGEGVELVPPVDGFHGGIFDDPATDKVNPAKTGLDAHDPFRGVGVIEAINQSQAEELNKHVENVLKKARPMGLCRLVLLRRDVKISYENYWRFKEPSQNFLIYASPALPMYDGAVDTHNFPISRCLWALRDFPDAANVEAMWFFYVPQGVLGQAMIDAPRGTRITELARSAHALLPAREQAKYLDALELKLSRFVADFAVPVLNATVEPDGKVKLVATYKTKLLRGRGISLLHGLEGRYGSRPLLPLNRSFLRAGQSDSGFPAYFRST